MIRAGEQDEGHPHFRRVPTWEQFPWLRAAFSTRTGGRSAAYEPGDQNLGWTADDDPVVVAGARRAFLDAAAGDTRVTLSTANQVHGADILDLQTERRRVTSLEGRALLPADGLICAGSGQFVGVVTADCVPVLIADTRKRVVGAFHAGWRGTLAGIVRRGVDRMCVDHRSAPTDLVAAIGPAIRPCCFAIGPEVRESFQQQGSWTEDLFKERAAIDGLVQTYMDLQEANRRLLVMAGVPERAIAVLEECTACTRSPDGRRVFFSHRAERGRTGRMLNIVGTVPDTSR